MEQKPSVGRIVHYQSYGSPGGEYKCGLLFRTFAYRSNDPTKARDELLRLATKAWMKMEEGK